ncbi:M4 family metallopeptidase, partial [Bacillus sp. SM2101]
NKAAYLISEGGTHSGTTVTGIGKDKLGQIYYRALTQYLTESSTFSQLRSSLIQSATDLYGDNGSEVAAISAAFDAVGVQ